MKYWFEMPSLPGIKDRLSTMTSAFANSIIPAYKALVVEVDDPQRATQAINAAVAPTR